MMPPAGFENEIRTLDRSARRREKSRDAARCRRQQESDTYNEICKVIPIPPKLLSQMDRSAVMRLLISFMKLRKVVDSMPFDQALNQQITAELPSDDEYVNALNGFIIVLSHDCDLLYVSSNVKQYIGMASLDLIGQNLFGYTHEGDHGEITNCMKSGSSKESKSHSFFMRMKSTLTSSGKNVNLKSATYKVLKCDGITHCTEDVGDSFMVAYCEPIPHPANIEMVLDCKTFLSQHSLDMKFTYCDNERVSRLLNYTEADMTGKSFYDFCHTGDLKRVESSMQKLFRLGQVTTSPYRVLAKYGGYVWLISEATIINNPRNQQPSYVVCVHYIISDVLEASKLMSSAQIEYLTTKIPPIKQEVCFEDDLLCEQQPQDCTEAVFCDSTNSIFCDDGLDDANVANFPDKALAEKIAPSTESMELMAQNAPSIGDEIDFSHMNFMEMFDNESANDLYNNAPSIGDPQWPRPPQIQEGKIEDLFTDVNINMAPEQTCYKAERDYMSQPQQRRQKPMVQDGRHHPPLRDRQYSPCQVPAKPAMMYPMKPQLPKSGYQVVRVPKAQYENHAMQLATKRDNHGSSIGQKVYKRNPPDFEDPPMKKQKFLPAFDATRKPIATSKASQYLAQNIPDAAKLLLSGKRNDARSSFASLLLKPGNMCDSYYSENTCGMERFKPCGDSDPSRCALPKELTSSLLPVLSLHDCEVNAPIGDKQLSTVDWMAMSSALNI